MLALVTVASTSMQLPIVPTNNAVKMRIRGDLEVGISCQLKINKKRYNFG